MSGLSTLLGYDGLAVEIATVLKDSEDLAVIEGAAGTGKSWLAKGIGGIWEDAGGAVLVAEGDRLQSGTPLYPLGFALAELASVWRGVGEDLAAVGTAGERLAGGTGVITAAVNTLVKLRPSRVKARKLYLGDGEQQILFDLDRLAEKRPLLLVADNLHWWDPRSLEFLARLRDPRMQDAFPFVQSLRVIAVQTPAPFQETSHPVAHAEFLRGERVRHFRLSKPDRDVFPAILRSFGLSPDRARNEAPFVFSMTGGHLALANRYARHIADADAAGLSESQDDAEFMRRLLTDRLHALGSHGEAIVAVLRVAAVLGLTFKRAELLCAFDGTPSDGANLLRLCRNEDLLELTDTIGRFSHEIFRQHFLTLEPFETAALHETVATCLRTLRPGEYDLRSHHALQAELANQAQTLGILASLKLTRAGLSQIELPTGITQALAGSELKPTLMMLTDAQLALDRYDYPGCFAALDRLQHSLPKPLAAEAAIMRGAGLIATRNEDDRAEAIILLRAWEGYVDEEPEIGLRLLQQLLYALTLDVEKSQGRQLAAEIRHRLQERADFDVDSCDALYVMDRSSGSLYEPDVSLIKVREAVEHFQRTTDGGVVRKPMELYRALTTLGAKEVTNALYREAVLTHDRIEQLIADYSPGLFPRLDFPRSTAILARLRAGKITVAEAALAQQELVDHDASANDPFYPLNALAIYRALDGDTDEALAILDRLADELDARQRPAPSLDYLIRANRVCVRYVRGESDLVDEWRELAAVNEAVPYTIRRFLIPRHALLEEVLRRPGPAMTAGEFDTCLLGSPRFGRMWDQLGRGFRLPEVEFWH